MKKAILFLILIGQLVLSAQNLVPNGSFESYTDCPYSKNTLPVYSYVNFATPWFAASAKKGSTYYNSCTNTEVNPGYGIPYNGVGGFQNARTDSAYVGVTLFFSSVKNYRQYIEVKLANSLLKGKTYDVTFYVSFANFCRYSIDAIGA